MFPGICKLNYFGTHWPGSMINLSDPDKHGDIFAWLEEKLSIVEIPFTARPEGFNSQTVNHFTDTTIPLEQRQQLARDLAGASELAWRGIVEKNAAKLGKGLSGTMQAWEAALPYCVDPFKGKDADKSRALRDFWQSYDYPNTHGCLFSGAGGGFLFVISDEPVEGALKIKINTDPIVKPSQSDDIDSEPHPVPFA